ncbi:uncharacterized protein TRIADDRAFT_59817 [Trichoplax adhaerens]|uniref:FBA domain-containing protein n=1 Tax=Trichoplax adhaerens TaxID=10228 RepID=B3S6I5_TRIAD|nr:hypothetical protein TRIADDRAFT_59817 [Trichoplax adhaerens]EDV21766.1 hypothetical protein TRIADDRAFT_59817 [Trichoplax adhaerens]|eukprot:XP_002115914.1 hypothetical protein TRIADDRAFT_59817 [Trichoplax adhaerens]
MATDIQNIPVSDHHSENQVDDIDEKDSNTIQSESNIGQSDSYPKVQIILESVEDNNDNGDVKRVTLVNGGEEDKVNEEKELSQVVQEDNVQENGNNDQSEDIVPSLSDENIIVINNVIQDSEQVEKNQSLDYSGSLASLKKTDMYYQGVSDDINNCAHVVWPLCCSIQLDFNVNGQYGGSTSLLIVSSTYNRETAAALLMLQSGFDSNHCRLSIIHQMLGKKHQPTFGDCIYVHPDVKGNLILNSGCGANFVTILSNHAHQTSLRCGLVCIPKDNELICDLPIKVDESDGGAAILLCSAPCEGRAKAKLSAFGALYLLRFGSDGNNFHGEKLYGDSQWKFSTKGPNSRLRVSGPKESTYCLYHNRPDRYQDIKDSSVFRNFTYHTQAIDGERKTMILKLATSIKHCIFIVLCSHSYGNEDRTISALYLLTVSTEASEKRKVRAGYFKGSGSKGNNSNVWKFSLSNASIYVSGPSGPCRYAILSNISDSRLSHGMKQTDHNQHASLAIADRSFLHSQVDIDNEKISGWLSQSSTLCITVDEKEVFRIKRQELNQESENKFTFSKLWPSRQRILGLHLIRVFAIDSIGDIPGVEGSEIKVELNGSPMQLIRQPNYVGVAVNCAGPSYENSQGVVYISENNFLLSSQKGLQGTNLKGVYRNPVLHQTIMNTDDGLLYSTYRTSNVAGDEKVVKYEFPIENGSYILKLHYIESSVQCCILQGKNATKDVQQVMKENDGELELGNTANYINLPISIVNGKFSMTLFEQPLCAFALFHSNKKKSTIQYLTPQDDHQQLSNLDNRMFWKMGGNWKVFYGTKGKDRALIFVSSNTYCRKFQEIQLTDYFPAEFWDKSPDIQAFEWYSGGSSNNKNDNYEFKVKLLRHGRKVVREYNSGQITDLSANKWHKEVVTFRNYGTGVRIIHFESSGQNVDGKFLNQGPIMAMASVRVKLRNIPRAGDSLGDITLGKTKSTKIGRRRRILHQVFLDNKGLLSDDEILNRQMHSASHRLRKNSGKLFSEHSLNTIKVNGDSDIDSLPFKESILFDNPENDSEGDLQTGSLQDQEMEGQKLIDEAK